MLGLLSAAWASPGFCTAAKSVTLSTVILRTRISRDFISMFPFLVDSGDAHLPRPKWRCLGIQRKAPQSRRIPVRTVIALARQFEGNSHGSYHHLLARIWSGTGRRIAGQRPTESVARRPSQF